ncbi:MAG: J domain-containing protein [Firmicutes bacterium]|nr:J domain-containing protein [Bacillota bacterium]
MAAKFQDYYEILGIDRDASDKEIKSAYRQLARKWHPDMHPQGDKEKVEKKFKRINEAYEVLKDPEKRSRYDHLGSRWKDGQDFQPPPDMDGFHFYTSQDFGGHDFGGHDFGGGGFSDFFEMLFGRAAAGRSRGGQGKIQGENLESELKLTIEEAYRGTVKTIRLTGSRGCPECGGAAILGGRYCPRCGGTGVLPEDKTIDIRVPAGVRKGSRIRLKGQGGEGLGGGARGDLLLKIDILPHPLFQLKGNDVESELRLRPEQAVLGDRVPVQTLDGRVNVVVPAGSRYGKKLRLRGKGFPDKQKKRGNHYVRLVIDLPHNLTDEEKKLYRQLRDLRPAGE